MTRWKSTAAERMAAHLASRARAEALQAALDAHEQCEGERDTWCTWCFVRDAVRWSERAVRIAPRSRSRMSFRVEDVRRQLSSYRAN